MTGINSFLEILLSHNFMPQITLLTRVTGTTATLIDNMLINSYENKCTSGNITASVTDHLSQFLIIENLQDKVQNIKSSKATILVYKIFKSKSFQSDIKVIDWSLATGNDDIDFELKDIKHYKRHK